MVCLFSEYCATPFTIEPVTVTYEQPYHGVSGYDTPDVSSRLQTARLAEVRSMIGVPDLHHDQAAALATRMLLPSVASTDAEGQAIVQARVPPTRSDVLQVCRRRQSCY